MREDELSRRAARQLPRRLNKELSAEHCESEPPQEPKPTREIPPIDAICARKKIREAKVIIENIKSNSSAKEAIAKAKEEEVKQQEQKVREQNTLLGSYRDIGLYKKDLYQVPLLGAEIYADVALL